MHSSHFIIIKYLSSFLMFQQLSNIMDHSSEKQKHKRKVRALPDLISKLLLHLIHQISLVSLMVPPLEPKTFLKSLTFWALSQKVCWAIHNKPIEVDYFDSKEVEVVVKIDFWKLFKNHSLLKFLGLSNKFNLNFVIVFYCRVKLTRIGLECLFILKLW